MDASKTHSPSRLACVTHDRTAPARAAKRKLGVSVGQRDPHASFAHEKPGPDRNLDVPFAHTPAQECLTSGDPASMAHLLDHGIHSLLHELETAAPAREHGAIPDICGKLRPVEEGMPRPSIPTPEDKSSAEPRRYARARTESAGTTLFSALLLGPAAEG
ncbi:hypothetical protein [Microbacterium elymi]|uniref:Uncharacterized protein n=1 Tax=Microbacterium elymi TaxID=2909587 RepID=A0ABY5NJD9_9MICO|nr:hypothetical protein [Microbacterium elymi]UUT35284.1 hypothetical protein L2X98_34500 [Microbacterium elymi]